MSKFPVIRVGADNAPAVILIQGMLYDTGYFTDKSSIDGIFGYDTKDKIERFQFDHRLYVDGVVGQDTWIKLISEWWAGM